MPKQSGPTTTAGKAASSKNAIKHGLNNLYPVVTAADRPIYESLREQLFYAFRPTGFAQDLTFQRLVNAAWNMQRCQKLETMLMEFIEGDDPLSHPDTIKQAALYQRYYLRFEGSYRANLRELERLQRLQIVQDVYFGDKNNIGVLHDLQLHQQFAKRNSRPAPTAPAPAENPQPQSGQQSAERNPAPYPKVGRNSPCPCASGKKYKRCYGVDAPPILHAA